MTLHGMTAFVGWGAFVSIGLGFYIFMKASGKPLHNARWALIAYWFFIAGFVLIVISALFGQFGASWVFLFPLPFYGSWDEWAVVVWTLGVLLAGVGILVAQTEVLMSIRSAGYSFIASLGFESFKPQPEKGYKVPLPIVPLAVNALGMIIATIPFAVLLVFFLIEGLIPGVDNLGIDALVAKNVLWWFGHPIVYELLFPVAAMAYYMVARVTNSTVLVGDRISRITWAVAVVIQNIIGSHHVYQDLVQPIPIQISQQLMTYVITLPSLSSIFVVMATLWARDFEWSIPTRYMYLATLGWLLAGMSGLVNATIFLNQYIHNTLWVVAHFHTMAILNITMMLFGAAYFLITDFTGNKIYNQNIARWAMWLKYIGTLGLVHAWFVQGILGGLRRSATSSPGTGLLTWLSIPFGLAVLVGIWMATWNMYKTANPGVFARSEAAVAAGD